MALALKPIWRITRKSNKRPVRHDRRRTIVPTSSSRTRPDEQRSADIERIARALAIQDGIPAHYSYRYVGQAEELVRFMARALEPH